jgi:hypothetical protein
VEKKGAVVDWVELVVVRGHDGLHLRSRHAGADPLEQQGSHLSCSPHRAKGPGEKMEFAFDMSNAVFFDTKTEQRVV